MIGFSWFSALSRIQVYGWPLPKFCRDVLLYLAKQWPVNTGQGHLVVPHSIPCVNEYKKFMDLITRSSNTKVLFLAVDMVPEVWAGGDIQQIGISTWALDSQLISDSIQWRVQNFVYETGLPSTCSATLDEFHVAETDEVLRSDIPDLLQSHWTQHTLRGYETVIVGHDIEQQLVRAGFLFHKSSGVIMLDTRKLWQHQHHEQKDTSLEACIWMMALSCKHTKRTSAGNNAFHIIQILRYSLQSI